MPPRAASLPALLLSLTVALGCGGEDSSGEASDPPAEEASAPAAAAAEESGADEMPVVGSGTFTVEGTTRTFDVMRCATDTADSGADPLGRNAAFARTQTPEGEPITVMAQRLGNGPMLAHSVTVILGEEGSTRQYGLARRRTNGEWATPDGPLIRTEGDVIRAEGEFLVAGESVGTGVLEVTCRG